MICLYHSVIYKICINARLCLPVWFGFINCIIGEECEGQLQIWPFSSPSPTDCCEQCARHTCLEALLQQRVSVWRAMHFSYNQIPLNACHWQGLYWNLCCSLDEFRCDLLCGFFLKRTELRYRLSCRQLALEILHPALECMPKTPTTGTTISSVYSMLA